MCISYGMAEATLVVTLSPPGRTAGVAPGVGPSAVFSPPRAARTRGPGRLRASSPGAERGDRRCRHLSSPWRGSPWRCSAIASRGKETPCGCARGTSDSCPEERSHPGRRTRFAERTGATVRLPRRPRAPPEAQNLRYFASDRVWRGPRDGATGNSRLFTTLAVFGRRVRV